MASHNDESAAATKASAYRRGSWLASTSEDPPLQKRDKAAPGGGFLSSLRSAREANARNKVSAPDVHETLRKPSSKGFSPRGPTRGSVHDDEEDDSRSEDDDASVTYEQADAPNSTVALLQRQLEEKTRLCEELQVQLENDWARSMDSSQLPSNVQEFTAKFVDLQAKLKEAIVNGRMEKAKLEDRIGILEFEKAEALNMVEQAKESAAAQLEAKVAQMAQKYQERHALQQKHMDDTILKYEETMAQKERIFQQRLKAAGVAPPVTNSNNNNNNGTGGSVGGVDPRIMLKQMEMLEGKLNQAVESLQLEKALLLERLSISKEEAKDAKERYEKRTSKLEKRVQDLKGKLHKKDMELLEAETKLQKEWALEMEEVEANLNDALGESRRQVAKLREQVLKLQEENRRLKKLSGIAQSSSSASGKVDTEEMQRLKEENTTLSKKLDNFKAEMKGIRDDYARKYKQKTADLKAQYMELQKQMAELQQSQDE